MSDLAVYVLAGDDAVPLHGLAPIGNIAFSTVFGVSGGCGLDSLSFSMTLPRGFSSPYLVQGALLELRCGPIRLGRATATTIDFETGEVTAAGLYKRGVDFIAFDTATFAGVLNPKVGVENAIASGLEWEVDATTLAAIDVTLATTGTTANVDATTWYTVGDLLDAYCGQQGSNVFWGIAGGALRIYQTPTTPDYLLSPTVPAMDSTTTDYVTDLLCRYYDITKPVGDGSTFYQSAILATSPQRIGMPRKFATEDITSHGPLTAAQAQDIADQTLATKTPALTYSGGVDLVLGDVRTIAGSRPVAPWRVVAEAGSGLCLRHHGWRNMQGALMPGFAQEWVVGKASYAATGSVSLNPTADAAKTIGQLLSSTATQVAEVGKMASGNDQKTTVVTGTLRASLQTAQSDIATANTFAQGLSDTLTQAQADIDSKISYGTSAPTDATPGTPGSVYYVQSGDPLTVTEQYLCTAGTGTDSGNTWEQQQLDAAQLIVPGTIEAEHMVATLDFTAKDINGGTFTGNVYRTGSSGRRMEFGHNGGGLVDPSNLGFFNGISGESPAIIGPYNAGGGTSGTPALALVSPAQSSYPYLAEFDLIAGSTATTAKKLGDAAGWATEPAISIGNGNLWIGSGDIRVLSGRIVQGNDTSGMVRLNMAGWAAGYGSPYGWACYAQSGDIITLSGLVKATASVGAGAWIVSGLPAPADGSQQMFATWVSATVARVYLQLVSGVWCIVCSPALASGDYVSLNGITYVAAR